MTCDETKEPDRWIPVSERLPDTCRTVLFCIGDWDSPMLGHCDSFYKEWKRHSDNYEPTTVTHWMDIPPLPKPPEAK